MSTEGIGSKFQLPGASGAAEVPLLAGATPRAGPPIDRLFVRVV